VNKRAIALKLLKNRTARMVAFKALKNKRVRSLLIKRARRRMFGR
jgi:hypothetical protein